MFFVNYRDSRPIYVQIKDGLRRDMLTGEIPPDGQLPSVRTLAGELAINPNTIQRAYRELEAEGYIYSIPGKGSFAAGTSDPALARKSELLTKLNELCEELILLGMSKNEIAQHIIGGENQ